MFIKLFKRKRENLLKHQLCHGILFSVTMRLKVLDLISQVHCIISTTTLTKSQESVIFYCLHVALVEVFI